MNNLWETIKNIFDIGWVENHLVYFSIVGFGILAIISVLIMIRLQKDINEMDKRSKERLREMIKETSKNKNKE